MELKLKNKYIVFFNFFPHNSSLNTLYEITLTLKEKYKNISLPHFLLKSKIKFT